MIDRMEPIPFLLGLLLIVMVVWDLFETIVVPRPTPVPDRALRGQERLAGLPDCWPPAQRPHA
jgi:hypothetical protein